MNQSRQAEVGPTIDLSPWWAGGSGRQDVARAVDLALQESGFMLVTGHQVPSALRDAVREASREFFALPESLKRARAAGPGGRGWRPLRQETHAFSEGTASPPDLTESLGYGADTPTGDPAVDARWFRPNPWPIEVPGLASLLQEYLRQMRALADTLMDLCAVALDLAPNHFRGSLRHPTYTFTVNHFPPASQLGEVLPGQFRLGPHTDFGTLTLIDREPGPGGLQVYGDAGWQDAPFHPDAITVNVGDLLARWTGDRWRSVRHRVPAPDDAGDGATAGAVSLAFFYECDPGALIESLPPPVGYRHYTPVYAADYLDEKYRALTLQVRSA